MGIRFFRGEKIKLEHEYRQLREIVRILREAYAEEPVYVLTGVLVANAQIDCIILTKNGPVLLDLKAFRGEIRGLENGNWEVETKDGPIVLPNLFIQAKMHRQDFIDRMIPICRDNFPHIGEQNLRKTASWLYFCRGSTYPEGQIDFRKVKWFRVVTADDLVERLGFVDSGYTLRIQDMDAIVRGFHLEEYSFEKDAPLIPLARPARRPLLSRKALVVLVLILALGLFAILVVLTVPGARIAAGDALRGLSAMTLGWFQVIARDTFRANTTPDESRHAILYLNRLRVAEGASPVLFDERAYGLALARARDMAEYRYLDYTNPVTGSSALALKRGHGFSLNETLIETLYGQWTTYIPGIETQAIDSWMMDAGNRQRLFFNQTAGAIACYKGYCSYIGVRPAVREVTLPPAENAPAAGEAP
ncbi:MAG: NERD domain-containing protein [Methanolinea sp.]|nr:NERD domain-containing protein [Methanolinea sp.]